MTTVSCTGCRANKAVPAELIRDNVAARCVPYCQACGAVIKPDVTFFGEPIKTAVKRALESDRNKADFLLVLGTSLQV